MKKLIKTISVAAIFLAVQGCTTHHTHNYYPKPNSIGIAVTPKGVQGAVGPSGTAVSVKDQRKEAINQTVSVQPGKKPFSNGHQGPVGGLAPAGMPAQRPDTEKDSDPNSFGVSFAKKVILKAMEWCIIAKCGS